MSVKKKMGTLVHIIHNIINPRWIKDINVRSKKAFKRKYREVSFSPWV